MMMPCFTRLIAVILVTAMAMHGSGAGAMQDRQNSGDETSVDGGPINESPSDQTSDDRTLDDLATDGAAAQANRPAGPALWHVTPGRTTARSDFYLFANLHILDGPESDDTDGDTADDTSDDTAGNRPNWLSSAVVSALARADTVWLEADMAGDAATQTATRALTEKGDNPPGVTLSSRLGKDAALIAPAASAIGAPAAAFDPMRPWKAHLIVNLELIRQSGFLPEADPGAVIRASAQAAGQQVTFLETSAAQFAVLTDLDAKTEESLLRATLATVDETRDSLPTLISAWRAGDMDAIDILMNAPLRTRAPLAYEALVINRNLAWTAEINKIARARKPAFIILGARHLAGPDSIIGMLQETGYDITRVDQ